VVLVPKLEAVVVVPREDSAEGEPKTVKEKILVF
jgi:hypothetical protein